MVGKEMQNYMPFIPFLKAAAKYMIQLNSHMLCTLKPQHYIK